MKVPLNLSDHLQELFGFLGFFPSPRGTPPQDLSSSVSAYFTQLSDKEEPELRTRRRTLLFFFPFWKLQHPVQPAASHPLQLWLSWHPDAAHEASVWSREYRVLDRSCLFFFSLIMMTSSRDSQMKPKHIRLFMAVFTDLQ